MPKNHFVEGEENFGVKLGRFLWSFNDKINLTLLIQNQNLFQILEGIKIKIEEWEERIKEIETNERNQLKFLNLVK